MPEPSHLPLRSRSKSFEQHLASWYGILGILAGVSGAGWAARGILLDSLQGKADAKPVATDHDRLERLEADQQVLASRVEDIHAEVRETRQDIRALAAGRPLPALTPTLSHP